MAVLDAWAITVLRNMGNRWQDLRVPAPPWPAPNALSGPGGKLNLACWNWTLSGYRHICVDPTRMFDYCSAVAADPQVNCPPQLGNEWFQTRSNMRKLRAIRDRFAEAGNANACRVELIHLAIEANGLQMGGAGQYQLAVYGAPNTPYPNWTHWWLEIEGATIEHFPNQPDVRIYNGGYSGGHPLNGLTVDRINLTGVHQEHKDYIQAILRNRRDSLVVRHPGGRQAWRADNTRAGCAQCNAQFGVFKRRHHCRCCGDIFCDDHSSLTRFVTLPATRPNTVPLARSAGRVRVCQRCCPVPP
ncbi:MAG: FYVE zinc finger domain-containing protein [Ramlibacter sp.]|nr:FYVE zinc finger domain-containing protein [Ramlibacter sp.]